MTVTPLSELARCIRVGMVLQSYLDGEVDELTAARVAGHLEDCRRCGLQIDTYRAIKKALRSGGRGVDDLALRRLRAFSRSLAEQGDPGAG